MVIGGGNSAIEESLFITKFAKNVTIVHQFDKLQANKVAQERAYANDKIKFILEHEPRAFIKKDDGTMDIEVEDLKSGKREIIHADGVFIFAGMEPNLDLFEKVQEMFSLNYHSNYRCNFPLRSLTNFPYDALYNRMRQKL